MAGFILRSCVFLSIAWGLSAAVQAGTRGSATDVCQEIAANRDSGEARIAIVIGNGTYGHGLPALRNPPHDASAVAESLSRLGFEVFVLTDATEGSMRDCLARAYGRMSKAAVGLFYYSGHGIQIKDENYLIGINARAGNLKGGFVPVQPIVDEIQRRSAATLVFLDACRNNPIARRGPAGLSVSTGRSIQVVANGKMPLVPVATQVHGLMVAYSTSPNSVALDGDGNLSPFTAAFVRKVQTPGYSIQRVMSEVTRSVGEQTLWVQTPWMKSSLTNELKLKGAQTLEEAQAVSKNWANESVKQLWTGGSRESSLSAALKGLPAHADAQSLELFPQAFLAVFTSMQARTLTLPVNGWPQGDDSTGDLVAVLHQLDGAGSRLELWSKTRRALVRSLAEYPANVSYAARFSPDGGLLLSFGEDRIAMWDVATGTKLFETVAAHDAVGGLFAQRRLVFGAGFSPDSKFVYVTASDKAIIQILDSRTGEVVTSLGNNDFPGVTGVSKGPTMEFMEGGRLCLVLRSDQEPETWVLGSYDLAARQFRVISRIRAKAAMHLSCDPAARYAGLGLLAENGRPEFQLWDMRTGQAVVSDDESVMDVSFEPAGRLAMVSSGLTSKVYDLSTGKETRPKRIPEGFRAMPNTISSATGSTPLTISSGPWFSWDLQDGPELVRMALSTLSPEQRASVEREQISFVGEP
jgi:WD40 repeat protein